MSSTQELRDQIIQKAWTDPEFKKQLLSNPESAIKDAFGVDIPKGYKLKVLEETEDTYYLVLPQSPVAKADFAAESGDAEIRWT